MDRAHFTFIGRVLGEGLPLPLFPKMPGTEILGKWVSGIPFSRKLKGMRKSRGRDVPLPTLVTIVRVGVLSRGEEV
jgi:hypothetical protein